MAHPRQLIREAAREALVGKTQAAERVYETRIVPWRRLELPAIAIYTLDEEVDPSSASTAPRELTRTVDLAIEAYVKQGDNVDDALDDIALEIERAMHADETLRGKASDSILASTQLGIVAEGEKTAGVAGLLYRVTYYTYAPEAADVQLDNFATADIRHNPGDSVHQDEEARDRLEGLDQ